MSKCFCGSKSKYVNCCKSFSEVFEIKEINRNELLLFEWLANNSSAHQTSFIEKTFKYIYRVSLYFENIQYRFNNSNFILGDNDFNETLNNIKLNINHSILSSLSLASQGLFLQSGVLHRTAFEDLFVILDFFENRNQYSKFVKDNYSVNGLVSRIKKIVPNELIEWYGYFTANFAHFSEIHTAPLAPRKCHPDNYILVVTFQNIVRILVTYDIIFERILFDKLINQHFWNRNKEGKLLIEMDKSIIIDWASKLGEEIKKDFPLDERNVNFERSPKSYTFK